MQDLWNIGLEVEGKEFTSNFVVNRVLIKHPEYREKLENRELEFLHFKNLDIKVKDPDFEI